MEKNQFQSFTSYFNKKLKSKCSRGFVQKEMQLAPSANLFEERDPPENICAYIP